MRGRQETKCYCGGMTGAFVILLDMAIPERTKKVNCGRQIPLSPTVAQNYYVKDWHM
jgi:hypothetical protein